MSRGTETPGDRRASSRRSSCSALLGSGVAPEARRGVIASVSPADPRSLDLQLGLGDRPGRARGRRRRARAPPTRDAGVRAWTVWVPDHDRESAGAARRPRATSSTARRGRWASNWPTCARRRDRSPPGSSSSPARSATIGVVNDRAYGIEARMVGSDVEGPGPRPLGTAMALIDGEPVACAIVLDHGGDACVTRRRDRARASGQGPRRPHRRGAPRSDARARGAGTGTLQASQAGAPSTSGSGSSMSASSSSGSCARAGDATLLRWI